MATKRKGFCVKVFRMSSSRAVNFDFPSGKPDSRQECGLPFARAARVARAEVDHGAASAHVIDRAGRTGLSCFRNNVGRVKCDASSVMRMAGSYQHVHLVAGDPAAGLRRRAYGGYPD